MTPTFTPSGKAVTVTLLSIGAAAAMVLVLTVAARSPSGSQSADNSLVQASPAELNAIRPAVKHFCGDCHAVPAPNTFPKGAWYKEVEQGFAFYRESGRDDLRVPHMKDVFAYYHALGPQELTIPPPPKSAGSSGVRFRKVPVAVPEGFSFPAVSHLRRWHRPKLPDSLLLCDMRAGCVRWISDPQIPAVPKPLASLDNPAHIQPADLDADGRTDFLVADLGSFQPADHDRGRVVWLRPTSHGTWETVVLCEGLGRVAAVRAIDIDSDGEEDLAVAEFGWRKTGRILLLERTGHLDGVPTFQTTVLDERHGTIDVPVTDINGDGRPDIVALISQEHESVVAFVNSGDGTFEKKTVYEAGDPSFGSSSLELVDFDGDGDQDVLYTNGDSLDSHYLKPYHAVHVLENRGRYPFRAHEVGRLPGAARALAGDLDGDGDLDIVACSYLPGSLLHEGHRETHDSLLWFEQTGAMQFVRHSLEDASLGHLALELGDFDGDGDLDLAVGNYAVSERSRREWFSIWWNEGRQRSGR